MRLSKKQLSRFWALFAKAVRTEFPRGISPVAKEEFRRGLIFRASGQHSLGGVNPGRQFDGLMSGLAGIAGDYEEAAYWGNSSERRLAHMMTECARQIWELSGAGSHGRFRKVSEGVGGAAYSAYVADAWGYCAATLAQARLPPRWEDVPEESLAEVFKMLDTHRRRILRRLGADGGIPLGFHPARRYSVDGNVVGYWDALPPGSNQQARRGGRTRVCAPGDAKSTVPDPP